MIRKSIFCALMFSTSLCYAADPFSCKSRLPEDSMPGADRLLFEYSLAQDQVATLVSTFDGESKTVSFPVKEATLSIEAMKEALACYKNGYNAEALKCAQNTFVGMPEADSYFGVVLGAVISTEINRNAGQPLGDFASLIGPHKFPMEKVSTINVLWDGEMTQMGANYLAVYMNAQGKVLGRTFGSGAIAADCK